MNTAIVHDDTPESILRVPIAEKMEFPADAIGAAVTRANAILNMVHNQLDEGGGTCTESVLANAIWAAQGIIAEIEVLAKGYWDHISQAKGV